MSLFNICLIIFLFAYGISVFIPERVIQVISGVAAIICAIVLVAGR